MRNSLPSPLLASLLLLLTLAPSPARPATLMPDPLLGTVTTVHLSVSPALHYERIPGLDITALETTIEKHCTEALRSAGFEVSNAAEASLSVVITHAWSSESRDQVALLTHVALRLLAEPVGISSPNLLSRRRTLTIWEDRYLDLVPVADARATILESIGSAMDSLSHARRLVETARAESDINNGNKASNDLNPRPRDITADQFDLRLYADWAALGRGEAASVEYRLFNASETPVCIGERSEVFRGARNMGTATVVGAPCFDPGTNVRPGETGVWRAEWRAIRCFEGVPSGFAQSFPELVCGSTVPVRAEVTIFAKHLGRVMFGSIEVVSEPVLVHLTPPTEPAEGEAG